MAEKELFPGQGRDEKVIIYERRHWFTLIQWLWQPLALLLASLLAAWGLTRLLRWAHVPLPFPVLALLWAIAVVPGLSWAIWRFLDWGNDRYIVTDQRVIHIEQKYFLREERKAAPLGMIQDVSVEIPGIMANLLYFGDVIIQTAGTLGTIRFSGMPKPRKAQVQIMTLVAQARGAEPEEDEAKRAVRKIVGWPPPEPKPLPPAAEGLRWESEKPRREQLLVVLQRMLFPVVAFGKNQVVWHKHWWVLLRELTSPLLALALLLVLRLSASVVFGPSPWFDVPLGISWAVVFVWLLWRTIDWWNDLYVLTDDRVVDIEKVPF
ncbi:MAG TPA: PH domain-containing protein, partial [Anaerolineae bacterium]|nr:PH domain-containing protein [Anaerolineae bacterium]